MWHVAVVSYGCVQHCINGLFAKLIWSSLLVIGWMGRWSLRIGFVLVLDCQRHADLHLACNNMSHWEAIETFMRLDEHGKATSERQTKINED